MAWYGGCVFCVCVQPSTAPVVAPRVEDRADGTYAVEYRVDHIDACSLHVTVDGHTLPDMPRKLTVVGEGRAPRLLQRPHLQSTRAPHTRTHGTGSLRSRALPCRAAPVSRQRLQCGACAAGPAAHRCRVDRSRLSEVVAGEPAWFELHCRTSSDEPVGVADLAHVSVAVYVKGRQVAGGSVQSTSGCGVYRCTVTVAEVGPMRVGVLLRNKDVSGSPFPVVAVAAAVCPSRCRASGTGVLQTSQNMLTSFTVKCFDAHGNVRHSAGSEDVRVEFCRAGEEEPDTSLAEVSGPRWVDGTGGYLIQYVVRKPGKLRMSVSIDGEPVANSPFLVLVSAAAPTAPAALLLHRPISPSHSRETAAAKHTTRAGASGRALPAARSLSAERPPRKTVQRTDSHREEGAARPRSTERSRAGSAVRTHGEAERRADRLAVAKERASGRSPTGGTRGIALPKRWLAAAPPSARDGPNRRSPLRYFRRRASGVLGKRRI